MDNNNNNNAIATFYTSQPIPTRPNSPVDDEIMDYDPSNVPYLCHYTAKPPPSGAPPGPVSSLPVEIVLRIFALLARANFGRRIADAAWNWIAVTHVCRYWRAIAIGYPALWRYIDIEASESESESESYSEFESYSDSRSCYHSRPISFGMVKASLERSSPVTLNVRCVIKPEREDRRAVERCLGLVLRHLDRIRELEIGASTSHTFRSFPNVMRLMRNPAPMLERFDVWYYPSSVQARSLPSALLGSSDDEEEEKTREGGGGEMIHSSLKSVKLRNYSICWTSTLFHGLTELTLVNSNASSVNFTIGRVLHIMRKCPTLELFVANMVKPDNDSTTTTASISDSGDSKARVMVSLPRMRRIEITETHYTVCEKLMSHLILPADVSWNFGILNYPVTRPMPLPNLFRRGQIPCNALCIILGHKSVVIRGSVMLETTPKRNIDYEMKAEGDLDGELVMTIDRSVEFDYYYPGPPAQRRNRTAVDDAFNAANVILRASNWSPTIEEVELHLDGIELHHYHHQGNFPRFPRFHHLHHLHNNDNNDNNGGGGDIITPGTYDAFLRQSIPNFRTMGVWLPRDVAGDSISYPADVAREGGADEAVAHLRAALEMRGVGVSVRVD